MHRRLRSTSLPGRPRRESGRGSSLEVPLAWLSRHRRRKRGTRGNAAPTPDGLLAPGFGRQSRREVPLTAAALAALDEVPPRIDSRYVFTTSRKVPGSNEPGPFDVANFRRRVWAPAIDSAGIAKPARIYDLRSTFISTALANGLTVFETARIAGTSVKMIEAHYGALIDTARESLLERLERVQSNGSEDLTTSVM
jgi:hypothetical protein